MPKIITSVNWSAQNVPSGLSFDPQTGLFSGTPVETGEYTIPVTVQTNYGKDTKDVLLGVREAYNVKAIGRNASGMSQSTETDEHGFYSIPIPKCSKLMTYYGGFRALGYDQNLYGCGLCGVRSYLTTGGAEGSLLCNPRSALIKDVDYRNGTEVEHVVPSTDKAIGCTIGGGSNYGGGANDTYHFALAVMRTLSNELILQRSGYSIGSSSTNTKYYNFTETITINDDDFMSSEIIDTPMSCSFTMDKALRMLSKDRTKLYSIRFIPAGMVNGHATQITTYPRIITTDLGGVAKKAFYSTHFKFLSEDNLLDNDASNFTFGEIKDAWVNGIYAYVLTTYDVLYKYDYNNNTWLNEGIYHIKKAELTGTEFIFLTENGKLYHQGGELSSIGVERHDDITQIFPECLFYDFVLAFTSSSKIFLTLVVLRED